MFRILSATKSDDLWYMVKETYSTLADAKRAVKKRCGTSDNGKVFAIININSLITVQVKVDIDCADM